MSKSYGKNLKTNRGSRESVSSRVERPTTNAPCSKNAVNDGNLVEVDYDNGYPLGFTISDNRDIWQGQERFQQLTFTLKTLGVWTALLSFPPGWIISIRHLRRVLGVGRDTLRTILAELEEKGRLKRVQVRKADGTYGRQRWVLSRGGCNCLPPSTPPAPDFQAPVDTDDGKDGQGPSPENQSPVSAGDWKAGSGSTGAGIPDPLVTTEVVPNTEASTTTSPASPTSPGLVPPPSLPPSEARVVVGEVEKALRKGNLSTDLAQPILDELEGAVRRGQRGRPIEKPVSYLRTLLERAQAGQFVPDAGLPIKRERQKRALEVENSVRRATQKRQHLATRSDPEVQRRIQQEIADCSRSLGIPLGPHRDFEPRRQVSASP